MIGMAVEDGCRPIELLDQHNAPVRDQWRAEVDFTRNVLRGAKAEDAFPDFIARKGRPLDA